MNYEIENKFIELLNDSYDDVIIVGLTFTPAQILEHCDKSAYNLMLADYENNL